MRRTLTFSVIIVVAVLSGCVDNAPVVGPTADRLNWDWDDGLRTFGGGPATLICSPTTVAFNGTVSCSLANIGPFNFPTWTFQGFGGVTVQGPNGMGGWSGPMVLSGDVKVNYVDNFGQPQEEYQPITVTRRSWSWASSVGGQQGTAGQIDSCFDPGLPWRGLTASLYCTLQTVDQIFHPRPADLSNGNGYVAATVSGSGPNGGLWYVSSTSADMDLRTQVKVWYRPDGPTYPMIGDPLVIVGCGIAFPSNPSAPRSIHTVNTLCVPTPAFTSFVNCAWSHEGQHLTAATTSAQSSANDVYKLWEPLVEKTSSNLQSALSGQYSSAHVRVRTTSLNAHNTMTDQNFAFWDYTPGWSKPTKTLAC